MMSGWYPSTTLLELVVPDLVLGGGAQLAVQLLEARVGLGRRVVVEPGEVVRVVHGHEELEPLGADRVGVLPEQVELRPLGDRVPLVDTAVPHREAVVVLGHRTGELGARVGEQLGPLDRVEGAAGRLELRRELVEGAGLVAAAVDEVVVRPGGRLAEDAPVVVVGGGSTHVHVPRVPLVVVRGNAEHAPVEVDAELGVLEPLRRGGVLVHRAPGGRVAGGTGDGGEGGGRAQQAGGGSGDAEGGEEGAAAVTPCGHGDSPMRDRSSTMGSDIGCYEPVSARSTGLPDAGEPFHLINQLLSGSAASASRWARSQVSVVVTWMSAVAWASAGSRAARAA
jgi:hypothetical protein